MYKSAAVCENCYLVYAEFVTAASSRKYSELDYTTKANAKTKTNTDEALQKNLAANNGNKTLNRQTAKPLMPSIPAPIYSVPGANTGSPYFDSKNYSDGLSVGAIIHQRGRFSNCSHKQKKNSCAQKNLFSTMLVAHTCRKDILLPILPPHSVRSSNTPQEVLIKVQMHIP